MRTFPLWAFTDGMVTIITRGQTMEQAMSYACRRRSQAFRKGSTIYHSGMLPINAAELYNRNHASGWLHRAPMWLIRLEHKIAVQRGVAAIIDDIKNGRVADALLYDDRHDEMIC